MAAAEKISTIVVLEGMCSNMPLMGGVTFSFKIKNMNQATKALLENFLGEVKKLEAALELFLGLPWVGSIVCTLTYTEDGLDYFLTYNGLLYNNYLRANFLADIRGLEEVIDTLDFEDVLCFELMGKVTQGMQ